MASGRIKSVKSVGNLGIQSNLNYSVSIAPNLLKMVFWTHIIAIIEVIVGGQKNSQEPGGKLTWK